MMPSGEDLEPIGPSGSARYVLYSLHAATVLCTATGGGERAGLDACENHQPAWASVPQFMQPLNAGGAPTVTGT